MSFKDAVNHAIRSGAPSAGSHAAFRTPTFDLGAPSIPVDRALLLAAELEDEALIRRLAERK